MQNGLPFPIFKKVNFAKMVHTTSNIALTQ